ncbi:MAG: DEAD/DEAH box helicase [Verrucomicrobiales bacterium]
MRVEAASAPARSKEPPRKRESALSLPPKHAPSPPPRSDFPFGSRTIGDWFARRGWSPLAFQREAWEAYAEGQSGLIHAPTGVGKTLAAWLGPVIEELNEGARRGNSEASLLRVIWLTPLRALAADTVMSLREPLAELAPQLGVAARTGDTSQSQRARLKEHLPFCLITTPESLSLLLSYPDCRERFSGLRCVIVDEWHELMSSKRGVQTELCLARLRTFNPRLRTWGLSASIGNLEQALEVLLGKRPIQAGTSTFPSKSLRSERIIIHSTVEKRVEIETLLPVTMEQFPWSGHLGTRMLAEVIERIERAKTTLLFTNVRSQTEIWFQELLEARPDWEPLLAMHHGSLERAIREEVERRLRAGAVKCVVCTSSLDLGVDFSPVDQVIQVGSPKGISRIMQRAGRSGHQPGAVSKVLGVPTNGFELVEFAAARMALQEKKIESRRPLRQPLDVLLQHLVTVAIGGGFRADDMLAEVRSTHAYAGLPEREWGWLLTFITTGGSLRAYPEYRKVVVGDDDLYHVTDARLARLHRMTIGTIVSDVAVSIRLTGGRRLGSVEEGFISRIRPGQIFIFGGRRLELVRHQGLVATVRPATKKNARGQIPTWQGSKSPLSTELASAVGRKLQQFNRGEFRSLSDLRSVRQAQPFQPPAPRSSNDGAQRLEIPASDPEMLCVAPILTLQQDWSIIPDPHQLLIEIVTTRDGHHAYVYPFAGRLVNEGLGMLAAYRMSRAGPISIQVTPNDYGIELHSPAPFDLSADEWRALFTADRLLEDLFGCLNTAELGRHQFREVARVAGLVIQGFPGNPKTARALQASSGLLYDVFAKYDPQNLLLEQAQREILERQLEIARLRDTLEGIRGKEIVLLPCERLSPMAFPLWADSISANFSTEDFATRLQKMLAQLEAAAAKRMSPDPSV